MNSTLEMKLDDDATREVHQLLLDTRDHSGSHRKVVTAKRLKARLKEIVDHAASRDVTLTKEFVRREYGFILLTSPLYNSHYLSDEVVEYLAKHDLKRDKLLDEIRAS